MKAKDWVKDKDGNIFWNDRVKSDEDAEAIYGENAEHLEVGTVIEEDGSFNKTKSTLGENGTFTNGGKTYKARNDTDRPLDSKTGNWDTDKNGELSLGEANSWYRTGNGQPIEVEASTVNIGYVRPSFYDGEKREINTLSSALDREALIYGALFITYNSNLGGFKIETNKYNFDWNNPYDNSPEAGGHPWWTGGVKGFFRNVETVAANVNAGFGNGFDIKFNGIAKPGTNFVMKENLKVKGFYPYY